MYNGWYDTRQMGQTAAEFNAWLARGREAYARELRLACAYYAKGNRYAAVAARASDPDEAVDARRQAAAFRGLGFLIARRLAGRDVEGGL